jgi:hypothetical protein
MSVRSNDREGTLHLVGNQEVKAAALTGRRVAGVAAAAVVTAALAGCTNADAADQRVIERLSKLEVMSVPPGAVELSRTSSKGGGNSVIRNASSVTLVYATTQEPTDVRKDIHARFDRTWHFIDSHGGPQAVGWQAAHCRLIPAPLPRRGSRGCRSRRTGTPARRRDAGCASRGTSSRWSCGSGRAGRPPPGFCILGVSGKYPGAARVEPIR